MGGGRDLGVGKEGAGLVPEPRGGGQGTLPRKKWEGPFLQGSQVQTKTPMIPEWYQNDTKTIPKWYQNDTKMIQYHFRIVLGSFVVSVRWGHGRVWGERVGDKSRTTLSNLTPGFGGIMGGTCRWEVCNFKNTAPIPTLAQPPPFPDRKGTGAPSPLSSCPM